MSLDAMKSIGEAEDAARQAKLEATQKAKKAIEQAEEDGRAAIQAAIAKGDDEVAHLMRASESKASESAKDLVSTTANRQAAMRAHAEGLIDKAAMLIIERIVNS